MRSGLTFSEVYSDLSSDVIEMLFNQSGRRRLCGEPAADRSAGNHLELFQRNDEHPVGDRPPRRRRRRLPRLAAPRALRSDRDEQRDHGARCLGHLRRLVVHARDRARLGAIRPALFAGRVCGTDDEFSRRDGSGSVPRRRRSRPRESTARTGGSSSSRRWEEERSPRPRIPARRVLCRGPRRPDADGHSVAPPRRRPAGAVDLHRRLESRGVSRRPSGRSLNRATKPRKHETAGLFTNARRSRRTRRTFLKT